MIQTRHNGRTLSSLHILPGVVFAKEATSKLRFHYLEIGMLHIMRPASGERRPASEEAEALRQIRLRVREQCWRLPNPACLVSKPAYRG